MNKNLKDAVIAAGFIAGALALGWVLTANQLALKKVFSPAFEQVRRETFEQSKSFLDGAVQELRSLQFEYVKAAPEHRAGLANIIKHKAVSIPEDTLPQDLKVFLKDIE